MLFVDRPEKFDEILPGFLPRKLVPADSVEDSFIEVLRRELFGPGSAPLMSFDLPDGARPDFWRTWYLIAEAEASQYDTLRRVISDHRDPPGHLVCLALGGRRFHGQRGRAWEAVAGNLHLSVAFRCDLDAADCGLAFTMLPAVAVVDGLAAVAPTGSPLPGLGIKWVNDILVDGRKIGGVLTSTRSQEGKIGSFVLGIGLNVGVVPQVPATPFSPGVTSLNEHIPPPGTGLVDVLESVLQALACRYEELVAKGPGPLLAAYRSASLVVGREVEIIPDTAAGGRTRRGRVLAIDTDLSLTLTDSDEPVPAGRLILMPETAP